MWQELRKHLKLYLFLLKLNAARQLEYRTNLLLGLLVESGYLVVKLIYAYVVHDTGVHIAGFAPQTLYLFIGTFILMTAFFVSMLQFNIMAFDRLITEGDFDLMLTKPVSTQFLATLRYAETWMVLPNVLVGAGLIAYGWSASGIALSLGNLGLYLLYMVMGVITMYGIFTLPMLLAFKFKHISSFHALVWGLWDFNNLPHRIFPSSLQMLGTFLLPIFLITNYSPLAILSQLTTTEMVWGIIAPILIFTANLFGWKLVAKHYESAGG
ncbi:ABC-2 family transporter protein [Pseudoalteromonas fenneropenaei]|uniref:ABC-2 family transporter protein n=1 Tax=Pseudoalteromonas fenneropenaei TaxID=1737459 RepID=A0ABV7CK52_9GAMM